MATKRKTRRAAAKKSSGTSPWAYLAAAAAVGTAGYFGYRALNKKQQENEAATAPDPMMPGGAYPELPAAEGQGQGGSVLDTVAQAHGRILADVVSYPARGVTSAAETLISRAKNAANRLTGATLQRGSRGQQVVELQNALIKLGHKITADGQFGPQTESALLKAGYTTPFQVSQLPALQAKANPKPATTSGKPIRPGTYTEAELVKLGYHQANEINMAKWLKDEIHDPKRRNWKNIEQLAMRKTAPNIVKAYRMLVGTWPHIHIERLTKAYPKLVAQLKGYAGLNGLEGPELEGLGAMISGGTQLVVTTGTLARHNSTNQIIRLKPGTRLVADSANDRTVQFTDRTGRWLSVPRSDVQVIFND